MMPLTRPQQSWKQALAGLLLVVFTCTSSAVIRDGGIDPANLGKGDWIYYLSSAVNQLGGNEPSVTSTATLMAFYKAHGIRFVMVKAATSDTLFPSNANPQFTRSLVNAARAQGILIFGYNRSYGSNVLGEIDVANYVLNQGADGYVWDAEGEWESSRSWIGTNGPAKAWEICSTVRSNWPNKFLAHAPFPIISYHSSFPYKEFGYWCDSVMPQIYPFNWTGVNSRTSGGINWTDVNWRNWQNSLEGLSSVINGETIHWTNAIKPIAPVNHVYGPNPPNSGVSEIPAHYVTELVDYLSIDPHTVSPGGYKGVSFWRADLHGATQWDNIQAATIGDFPGIVNNIIVDNPQAVRSAGWTAVRVFYNGASFGHAGDGTGGDLNCFGTNYLAKARGDSSGYVEFQPVVVMPGPYDVYAFYPVRTNATASAPFYIQHAAGATTVQVNQQTGGGRWNLLGRFRFNSGTNSVRLYDNIPEPDRIVLADGLKLMYVPPAAAPAAPTGLTASALNDAQIRLSWTDVATNEVNYVVARGTTNGGAYTDVVTLAHNATNYTDNGLAPNTAYYYVVRSMNPAGASAHSAQASATTLPPTTPPSLIAQPVSATIADGRGVTFSVGVSGTPPFAFQWLRDNNPIPGATSQAYALTNAQPADAGGYQVVVTNLFGAATSAVATLTVLTNVQPPTIAVPPQGTNVLAGQTAVLAVSAAGTAPLAYQWQRGGIPQPGATNSQYTLANCQLPDAGNYTVVVTNLFGAVTSAVAVVNVLLPPSITVPPADITVTAGQNASFSVAASGTPALSYQWRFEGASLPGANATNLILPAVTLDQAGRYDVVVTNGWGVVTSRLATLTVNPPPPPSRFELMWSLAPFSRAYVTTNQNPNERSIAYNAGSKRLLLASRLTTNIHVLDGDTGAYLHNLNMTGVSGGIYALLVIATAEDGAVYGCNLTTAPRTNSFKLYRWANDDPDTVPTLAFSGDPHPAVSLRWGDTIDARGSGAGAQVLIASRNGQAVSLLTTTNGLDFAAAPITVADTPAFSFGLGIAFGAGNTFWGTARTNALRLVAFDPAAGTGVTVRLHDQPDIPHAIAPIGVHPGLNLLGGIHVASPNHLRLYDLTLTNATPVLLFQTNFPSDNDNTFSGTGAVDFSADRVFAYDANNGLLAIRIQPVGVPPSITAHPVSLVVTSGQTAVFSVTASGTAPLAYQWRLNGAPMGGATAGSYTLSPARVVHAGSYSVMVSNALGARISQGASLAVTALPLSFQGVNFQEGALRLRGSGEPGGFKVEATSTPFSNWVQLTNVVITTNGDFEFLDPVQQAARRFYRLQGQ